MHAKANYIQDNWWIRVGLSPILKFLCLYRIKFIVISTFQCFYAGNKLVEMRQHCLNKHVYFIFGSRDDIFILLSFNEQLYSIFMKLNSSVCCFKQPCVNIIMWICFWLFYFRIVLIFTKIVLKAPKTCWRFMKWIN